MTETEESQDIIIQEEKKEVFTETTLVIVKLDIKDGDKFSSFKEFDEHLQKNLKANYLRYSKRDSRTLEGAKRKLRRNIRTELEFYQLKYACFFAHKHRQRSTGKRIRRSIAHEVSEPCPAGLSLRVTEDGQYLEVYNVSEVHNHPVNEQEYMKLAPKKKSSLGAMLDATDLESLPEMDKEAKLKMVLKKCRYIARIASVSSNSRVQHIMKNLDDFIYYLKYTTSAEDMMELEKEDVKALEEGNNNVREAESDPEQIKIIVQSQSDDEPMDS